MNSHREHAGDHPNTTPRITSPILVTGAHRTGTTWVGKMLSAGGETAYISEPLNVLHRPGVFSAPIRRWYTYICTENEAEYLPAFRRMLAFQYHTLDELRSLQSRKDALRMGRDWMTFMAGKLGRKRPLLKDPFAVFSAPWFAERLGCRVVITIRHPAAFASSLKRLDWPFEFKDLLEQPLLMQHLLEPYRFEIEAIHPMDIIAQAGLLWKIVYQVVAGFLETFPELITVHHENLSLNPMNGYRALYEQLGLAYNARAQQAVRDSSSPTNPEELAKESIHAYQLDSLANLSNWKERLTEAEVERIQEITGETAAYYYPALSWN
jgi:adenine-specific DNA methylase